MSEMNSEMLHQTSGMLSTNPSLIWCPQASTVIQTPHGVLLCTQSIPPAGVTKLLNLLIKLTMADVFVKE